MKAKGWLQENIVSVIAIGTLLFCAVIICMILSREVKSTDTNTTIILTGTFNIMMLILGFYFVSSKSNKEKDKKIEELTKPNENTPTT